MTESELKLREQAIKSEHLEKIADTFNDYIDSIRSDTVARLSLPLTSDELMESHAILICLQKLQSSFKADLAAGKIANKELMNDV